MNNEIGKVKRRWSVKWIIWTTVLILLFVAGILLYQNFNRILSDSLMKSFNSNINSDVYELKFENLQVNIWNGSIRVYQVSILPREKPLNSYPYINSYFRLKTNELTLDHVDLVTLLKSNRLELEKIKVVKPDIELMITGRRYIFFPFKDSTVSSAQPEKSRKRNIDAFRLNEFQLKDASFHIVNSAKQREFSIEGFSILLRDLQISQLPGKDMVLLQKGELAIGGFATTLQKGPVKRMGFKNFKIGLDSLSIQNSVDTLLYSFHDINAGVRDLDLQTADSIFHVSMRSFDLSYKDRSIKIRELLYKPNVSNTVLQKKYKFQHTDLSGSVGSLDVVNMNFDSLIRKRKIFIDEVLLDKVAVSLFKDRTKPMDKNKKPSYLGQTIAAIPLPVLVKLVKVTRVNLLNMERKPDSTNASVRIARGTVHVKNITNLKPHSHLDLNADAYLEDKVHFTAGLSFDYDKPRFRFEGLLKTFSLPDLTPLIQAYTPAKINKGIADEISFTGIAEETSSSGTMKFLYHDLEVDLALKEKAKWKSSVLAFAANTALHNSNPPSNSQPPRIVKFHFERDMNKSFVNVVIKSILNGLKETMIMSKENKKAYKEAKKKAKG